jgi:alkanesulfonate monooxygenase SsuD/methylene tetrahydromethanopterin reductase-like flavin-dependent oxidoreductase (luciferase family)
MHIGLVMECDYREGRTQGEAFDEAFLLAETAEALGFDGIWLAERHFAAPGRPLDAFGAGIPSIASAPLVLAAALAARTTRLRLGIAVAVLPLYHPIRLAEEAATVDQISRGRLDFGVGRSGFPKAYEGYGVAYQESRERFREALAIVLEAWKGERFSYQGKYWRVDDVCVVPQPYQRPHPPIRIAATTRETFPLVGRMGSPIFVGLRGFDVAEVAYHLGEYRQAWRQAGHGGDRAEGGAGDVYLRMPVYVADTPERARAEPEASTMRSYRRLAETFASSAGRAGTTTAEARAERAARLAAVSYDELLRDRLAYGTPDMVAERLAWLRDELELTGVIVEANVGGGLPLELVRRSLQLFAREVAPRLRR